MKKTLLLSLITLLTIGVSKAQLIKEGNLYVNAGATGIQLDFGSGSSIGLSAEVGYFIMDKLAIGGLIDINSYTPKGGGNSSSSFSIMGGVRYYIAEQPSGALFCGAYMGVLKLPDNKDNTFTLGFQGGYSFFVKENIAIEPTLNIMAPFAKGYDATFSIGCGFSLFF